MLGRNRRDDVERNLRFRREEAVRRGWDSLAAGKFIMFAYNAARERWISDVLGESRPSPWRSLVAMARKKAAERSAPEPPGEDDHEL